MSELDDKAAESGETLAQLLDRLFKGQGQQVMSDAIAGWARVLEHTLSSTFALWKIPMEMMAAEDESLGVRTSSFNVPWPPEGLLRCTGARLVPAGGSSGLGGTAFVGGLDVGSGVTLEATEAIDPHAAVRLVKLTMPPDAPPGLYELTITNETTGKSWRYCHPFGVPGRRP